MNKTKKLTQGAMLLAIVGAMIIIDRITAYWFSEIVTLMVPVVIIMYSSMQTFKDGLLLSVGILIITFLLANFNLVYLLYVPAGIITGLAFAYAVSKNINKRTLMFVAIIVYIACEVIITFVVYPLLGYPIANYIAEYKSLIGEAGFDFSTLMNGLNFDINNFIVLIYIISTILVGLMEGVLISILSIFLLKRFKIKDLGIFNLLDVKANPVLAYICMLGMMSFAGLRYIQNETIYYVVVTLCIVSTLILIYYGYIFVCLYGTLILKKRISSFVVLLGFVMPPVFLALAIIGFLYASGPFRRKIEERLNIKNE